MNPSKSTQTNETSLFVPLCLITLSIPVLIFMMMWLNWYCALPASIILVLSLFLAVKNAPRVWAPTWGKSGIIKWGIIISLILVWVYFSGIGGYSYQSWDFQYRNIIFSDLIQKSWPIISTDNGMDVPNSFFVYYIAYWLPAALVGKAFGLDAGNIALFIWTVFMILLAYYSVCVILKKTLIWPLIIFIFFSGMDVIGFIITKGKFPIRGVVDEWSATGQFSSITTQLYWVFNQSIAAWVTVFLLFAVKMRRSYIFVCALLLLYAPLPVVGLAPIVLAMCFYDHANKQYYCSKLSVNSILNNILKPLISFENIIGAGSITIIIFLYYTTNISGQTAQIPIPPGFNAYEYILFMLLEWLILFFLIYKSGQRSLLLIVCILIFLICPFIIIGTGGSGDFCMRASIPALVILYIYTIKALQEVDKKYILTSMIIVLSIGSITPLSEGRRSLFNTFITTENKNLAKMHTFKSVLYQPPFTDNFRGTQDSFFYRYMARKVTEQDASDNQR